MARVFTVRTVIVKSDPAARQQQFHLNRAGVGELLPGGARFIDSPMIAS